MYKLISVQPSNGLFGGLHIKKNIQGTKTLVAVGLLTVRRWLTTFDCLRVQIDNQEIWCFSRYFVGSFSLNKKKQKKHVSDINRPAYARYDFEL